ncbi:MAG: hypothetical protein JWO86_2637 [Myxococcaceae bacterium]|jgi:hypothetical protein|nr:hypothetical protein [Myxococcaceae bacterium]
MGIRVGYLRIVARLFLATSIAAIAFGATIIGACGFSGVGEVDQATGNGNA